MRGVTEAVREALAELGLEVPDAEVKAFVRLHEPTIPESQVGLALRKLRGRTISARSRPPKDPHGESGRPIPADN
jgi:hypothetical protein